jgi:hypothetical protein
MVNRYIMLLENVMNLGRIFLKGNEEGRGGLKRINRSQPISHLIEKPHHLSTVGTVQLF